MFLVAGPRLHVDLGLSLGGALVWDAALSATFFVQHSGMIRAGFRRRLRRILPDAFHGAVFSIASGVCLVALVLLWQPASDPLVRPDVVVRATMRGASVLALIGFVWGARALGGFDTLGLRAAAGRLPRGDAEERRLTVRGPYRWVRHPFYLFSLVLFWSFPDLTADRLLFNTLWTSWVVIGTVLEERDLVTCFGESYREYQRTVPMLIPLLRRTAKRSRQGSRIGT